MLVVLMSALEGGCGTDPRSSEFIAHYTDQIALFVLALGPAAA
ncbi:hypothetical protein [Nocardia brasiliensis]|nr:hypothetical protein [Nocardia brasiliensis]